HYRLEVPAGRYYIAAGSVASPTYFPDTTALSAAKTILITAGTTVDGINFSKFVAAPLSGRMGLDIASILARQPNSTGVLSGILRFDDGKPASNITVVAIPSSTLKPGSTTFFSSPSEALNQIISATATTLNPVPASLLSL